MGSGTRNYKAFISYSHEDSRWAKRVHRYLENYRIPKRLVGEGPGQDAESGRLGSMFRDRDELPSSADLDSAAQKALGDSEFLVVVCSPRSAASRWVNEEIMTFKRLGRENRILCIIVDGEPNATDIPGRESEECFCPALRHRIAEDGRLSAERVEPLAADARQAADGWKRARLKLVAGLLDVGLDDLRQRELQRRNRRLVAMTSAAVAGMTITLMLAVTAYTARNDAERRRGQAEDLIAFMLGDLRERLNEVGRLDVLDSVAERAMDYFAELPPSDVNDDTLGQRSEALIQLGQVQMSRGDPDAAMEPFMEALAALRELADRQPDNPKRQFDLGQAHFWVGYAYWEKGALEKASEGMERYHEISERLYASDPGNTDYLLELGSSVVNLAVLANRRGNPAEALAYSERSVELARETLKRDPGNQSYRRTLAESYSWNGSVLLANLQLDAAANRFLDYLGLSRAAMENDPDDSQWLENFMLANRFVGDAVLDLGRIDDAERFYREGITAAERLLDIEPGNNRWQVERAILMQKLSHVLLHRGLVDESLAILSRLDTVIDEQMLEHGDDLEWRTIRLEARTNRAKALRHAGDDENREVVLGRVFLIADSVSDVYPDSEMFQRARAYLLLEANRPEDVIALFESGVLKPRSTEELCLLVLAHARSGRLDEVGREMARLEAAGYRHPGYVTELVRLGVPL